MRESSLSASQAKKVSKNLLVYFWFTDNLLNIHDDLRAGTFSFARKRITVDVFQIRFLLRTCWIYKYRRIHIDYGPATNGHDDKSKAHFYDQHSLQSAVRMQRI